MNEDLFEYLKKDFDPTKLTIRQMKSILSDFGFHNLQEFQDNVSKKDWLEFWNLYVTLQREKLEKKLNQGQNMRASGRGIEAGPGVVIPVFKNNKS